MAYREIHHDDWLAQARSLFGENPGDWRWVCPSCGHVARMQDWLDAGAPREAVAFSCIGRWTTPEGRDVGPVAGQPKEGPCNYAGGGLFRMNPVKVKGDCGVMFEVFEFDGVNE